uniref:C2H2-type domain-containing protein n=1 Tax=Scylla olivacea TaxID=85551 RepID=A0A0P4WP66_SCYOL
MVGRAHPRHIQAGPQGCWQGVRRCHSLQGGGDGGKSGGGEGEVLACSVCGKLITGRNRRQRLRYHLSTHSGERPHRCPFCPYRAHHKFTLDRHVRTVHRAQLVPLDPLPVHNASPAMQTPAFTEDLPMMASSVSLPGFSCSEDMRGTSS